MADSGLSGEDIAKLYQDADAKAGFVAPTPTPSAAPSVPTDEGASLSGQDIAQRYIDADKAAADAAQQAQAAQPQTTWTGVAKNAAAALTDAGANVLNLAANPSGTFGKALAVPIVAAHDFLAPYLGYQRFPDDVRHLLLDDQVPQPGTQAISALANAAGVDPSAVPANTTAERLTREGVGAAGTAAVTGPNALVRGIVGATGAVTGDTAASMVPDWAKPVADEAGNVLGSYGASKGAAVGGKAVNAVAGASSPIMDAYRDLGIDTTLAGDVSGSPTLKAGQAYSSLSPGGASVISPKEQVVVGQWGKALEDTASKLGTSTNAQAAGDVLQNEARNWKNVVFPQREAAAWAPVDQAMANATVDPANYRASLGALAGKLQALPETQRALLPPKMQTMLDAINTDVPAGSTMPWQQAQQLRSAIGNIMGVPEIVQSVGKDQLKAAYGGISQDMKTSATANGADAAFANANAVSTAGHAFIDNTLSKVIRSNNPAQETINPEGATKSILGSGDSTLQAVRQEMPHAADELAAYKLRDMALATPGQAGATGAETSVGSFLTDLNRMRQATPGGTKALFADPAVAQKVDNLAIAADSMKSTARMVNTSKTSPALTVGQTAAAAYAGYQAGGWKGALASAAAPYVFNHVLARGVSSPAVSSFAAAPGLGGFPTTPRGNPGMSSIPNPLVAGVISSMEADRQRNALAAGTR